MTNTSPFSIAVIGGGLAGLAAAEAASRFGLNVELFEQAAQLGGRAGSFIEPFDNRTTDYCRHAAMGCCTNFLDFIRRTGVTDCFSLDKTLHFIGPDNLLSDFTPSRWLPAPFHLLGGMKKLGYLSATDRRSIGRAIKRLAKTATDGQFADWLQSEKQSQAALDLFWSVFVHGALGDTLENVSISAAKKVFVDGFLSHRDAGDLILSGVPLSEIFDVRVAKYLTERGVKIHRRERVEWIEADDEQQLSLVMPDGDVRPFDAVILAVAWHQASNLFPPTLLDELPELESAQKLSPGSIISVHLYFDRPITALPHAILPGKLSQWIFRTAGEKQTSYQVVISAAHRLAPPEKDALLALVLEELETVFPDVKSANLLHSRVVVQPQAIFTMTPGVEKLRPSQTASLKNLFFAGDWTDTAWPATMEGAVRSGYAALEKLLRSLDQTDKILAPDLPKGFFSKKFLGPR